MNKSKLLLLSGFLAVFLGDPAGLKADATGADPGLSGAPGDSTCLQCHGTTANSGGGSLSIAFAKGNTYTPGQTQLVTVSIQDSTAKRWGFEVSPRVSSSASTMGGGILAAIDSYTRLAGTSGTRQWITHTTAGTRAGTGTGVTFQFNWTAPSSDVGPVDFYVAGNAANNNNRDDSGDHIYTTKATLTAATPVTNNAPTISSGGVVNGASYASNIAAGSWVTIQGSNLAPSTTGSGHIWTSSEIVNGKLPTSLDGVSVTIDGKAASVYYVSNTQINVQAPDDTATGSVPVVVTNSNGTSNTFTATLQQFSPGLFLFDPQNRKYPAAVFANGSYIGPAGLFGTALTTRPATAGDIILLYGTGFGLTSPAVVSGQVYSGAAATANPVTVTIGGLNATVQFSGLVGAGLYQINVVVPSNVASGDQPLVVSVGGLSTQSGVYIPMQ